MAVVIPLKNNGSYNVTPLSFPSGTVVIPLKNNGSYNNWHVITVNPRVVIPFKNNGSYNLTVESLMNVML